MPYAPNAQSTVAQTITDTGNAIFEDTKNYRAAKMMGAQSIAKFEAAASQNPDILQFLNSPNAPADVAGIVSKLGKGGSLPYKDAAVLAQFADTYTSSKAAKQAEDIKKRDVAAQEMSARAQMLNAIGNSRPKPVDALDTVAIRQTGPNGEPIEITYDKRTGREVGRGPVGQNKYVLTPTEQIEVAGGTESAKQAATQAQEFVTSIADAAENAQSVLAQTKQVRDLYDRGLKTGFGQDFVTQGGALLTRAGLLDPAQQGDREMIQKLLAGTALQTAKDLMHGTGQVSNYERQLVNAASAEVGKTPLANLRIMQISEAIATRTIEAEKERQKMVDDGKTVPQIAEALRRWRTSHPLTEYIEGSGTKPTAPTAGPNVDDLVNKYLVR